MVEKRPFIIVISQDQKNIFAFCVSTFEPIEAQACSAPQNDRLNLIFVKNSYIDCGKLAKNGQKTTILADGLGQLAIDNEYAALLWRLFGPYHHSLVQWFLSSCDPTFPKKSLNSDYTDFVPYLIWKGKSWNLTRIHSTHFSAKYVCICNVYGSRRENQSIIYIVSTFLTIEN